MREKRVAEFFAGIGLVGLGLESAGWSLACANDLDPQKHEFFCGHFPNHHNKYLVEDVHRIASQPERVPTVALATASFPCNDLSLAGSRSGLVGPQSSAFWGFIEVLRALELRRPPLVMLENVVGFLSSRWGESTLLRRSRRWIASVTPSMRLSSKQPDSSLRADGVRCCRDARTAAAASSGSECWRFGGGGDREFRRP